MVHIHRKIMSRDLERLIKARVVAVTVKMLESLHGKWDEGERVEMSCY